MVPMSCSTSPAVRLGLRVGVYSRLDCRVNVLLPFSAAVAAAVGDVVVLLVRGDCEGRGPDGEDVSRGGGGPGV